MSSQVDEAVVLRLTEYSETSQIVTLFARDAGHLRLIAKGARRGTRTRFATGLDLLERGQVRFIPPRGDASLGTQTEWVQRDAYTELRRDLLRLHGGLYAAELIPALTEPGDPHPTLYAALVELLDGLCADTEPAHRLPTFQLELLRAVGYEPNLRECTHCGHAVSGAAIIYFSAVAGGLLCRDCEVHHVEKHRVPPRLLDRPPSAGDIPGWFELFDYHLAHIAGKRPRTSAILAQAIHRPEP